MDRFEQMRVFVAVIEAHSFVGAAEALGLSKAAVSRHVAELETRLDVRLLHRTTRRLSLTPEGETFFARSKEVLAGLEDAEADMARHGRDPSGVLRINVPLSFGLQHLSALWPAFMAQYPRIVLDVTMADRMVDLVEEGFDMAVRIGRLPPSTLVSRPLARTRLVLCASPPYLQRHGTPQHPDDLTRHATLAYTLFSRGDLWPFSAPDGSPVQVRVHPRMRSNSGDVCRAAALQHQGIVLQPSFLVGHDLAEGTLVEVLPAYRSLELDIHAIYPSRRHMAPKVRLMVDFLAEAFRLPGWPA